MTQGRNWSPERECRHGTHGPVPVWLPTHRVMRTGAGGTPTFP